MGGPLCSEADMFQKDEIATLFYGWFYGAPLSEDNYVRITLDRFIICLRCVTQIKRIVDGSTAFA